MHISFEYELISSRKNKRITDASALSDKKFRDRSGLFCAEGAKLLEEILDSGVSLSMVFFTEKAAESCATLLERASNSGADMFLVTDEVMDKLTDEKAPQGVFSCAQIPSKKLVSKETLSCGDGGFLILDNLQNPGNVGTIIRTAVSLGLSNIILCAACADVYSSKVLRGAMGAVFRANLLYCDDVCKCVSLLTSSGKRVYAAALTENALPVGSFEFKKDDSIVIGNEGHGLCDSAVKACTDALIIPMQCGMDSLNAGIAAALLIWEKTKNFTK